MTDALVDLIAHLNQIGEALKADGRPRAAASVFTAADLLKQLPDYPRHDPTP